jgi:hypothetical protein
MGIYRKPEPARWMPFSEGVAGRFGFPPLTANKGAKRSTAGTPQKLAPLNRVMQTFLWVAWIQNRPKKNENVWLPPKRLSLLSLMGGPAVIRQSFLLLPVRSVALRPYLSAGLPFSDPFQYSICVLIITIHFVHRLNRFLRSARFPIFL